MADRKDTYTVEYDVSQALRAIDLLNKQLGAQVKAAKNLGKEYQKLNPQMKTFESNAKKAAAALGQMAASSKTASNNLSSAGNKAAGSFNDIAGAAKKAGAAGKKAGGEMARGAKEASDAADGVLISWKSVIRLLTVRIIQSSISAISREIRQATGEAAKLAQAMSEVQTISLDASTGAPLRSFEELSTASRNFSDTFNVAQADVVEAAYQAVSNQVEGAAESFDFLTASVKFQKAAATDLTTSVSLLSAALNSYDIAVEDADRVSAIFFKTIEKGRIRASELANDFGRSAVLGKTLGINIEELNAAFATTTIQGVKFNNAQTLINNIMLKLIKPTERMKEIFKEWGVSSGEAAIQTFGFGGVLERLNQIAAATPDKLGEIGEQFGRIRAITGATIFGENLEDYNETLTAIISGQESFAQAVEIRLQNQGEIFQREMLKVKNFFITDVGQAIVGAFADWERAGGDLLGTLKTLAALVTTLVGTWLTYELSIKAVALATTLLSRATKIAAATQLAYKLQVEGIAASIVIQRALLGELTLTYGRLTAAQVLSGKAGLLWGARVRAGALIAAQGIRAATLAFGPFLAVAAIVGAGIWWVAFRKNAEESYAEYEETVREANSKVLADHKRVQSEITQTIKRGIASVGAAELRVLADEVAVLNAGLTATAGLFSDINEGFELFTRKADRDLDKLIQTTKNTKLQTEGLRTEYGRLRKFFDGFGSKAIKGLDKIEAAGLKLGDSLRKMFDDIENASLSPIQQVAKLQNQFVGFGQQGISLYDVNNIEDGDKAIKEAFDFFQKGRELVRKMWQTDPVQAQRLGLPTAADFNKAASIAISQAENARIQAFNRITQNTLDTLARKQAEIRADIANELKDDPLDRKQPPGLNQIDARFRQSVDDFYANYNNRIISTQQLIEGLSAASKRAADDVQRFTAFQKKQISDLQFQAQTRKDVAAAINAAREDITSLTSEDFDDAIRTQRSLAGARAGLGQAELFAGGPKAFTEVQLDIATAQLAAFSRQFETLTTDESRDALSAAFDKLDAFRGLMLDPVGRAPIIERLLEELETLKQRETELSTNTLATQADIDENLKQQKVLEGQIGELRNTGQLTGLQAQNLELDKLYQSLLRNFALEEEQGKKRKALKDAEALLEKQAAAKTRAKEVFLEAGTKIGALAAGEGGLFANFFGSGLGLTDENIARLEHASRTLSDLELPDDLKKEALLEVEDILGKLPQFAKIRLDGLEDLQRLLGSDTTGKLAALQARTDAFLKRAGENRPFKNQVDDLRSLEVELLKAQGIQSKSPAQQKAIDAALATVQERLKAIDFAAGESPIFGESRLGKTAEAILRGTGIGAIGIPVAQKIIAPAVQDDRTQRQNQVAAALQGVEDVKDAFSDSDFRHSIQNGDALNEFFKENGTNALDWADKIRRATNTAGEILDPDIAKKQREFTDILNRQAARNAAPQLSISAENEAIRQAGFEVPASRIEAAAAEKLAKSVEENTIATEAQTAQAKQPVTVQQQGQRVQQGRQVVATPRSGSVSAADQRAFINTIREGAELQGVTVSSEDLNALLVDFRETVSKLDGTIDNISFGPGIVPGSEFTAQVPTTPSQSLQGVSGAVSSVPESGVTEQIINNDYSTFNVSVNVQPQQVGKTLGQVQQFGNGG